MFGAGLKILAKALMGPKPQPKEKREVDTVGWALGVADSVLRAKSKGKYWLNDPAGRYIYPHAYGCAINDDGVAAISGVNKYAEDVQEALVRRGYKVQVTIRRNPVRLEIALPNPPALLFSDYWPKIKRAAVGDFSFNGAVYYREKPIWFAISLAKSQYAHGCFTGATRSGKTVLLYDALLSLTMRNSPENLSLVICDRKGELPLLSGLPHLACEILTNMQHIGQAVRLVVNEMERRGKDKSGVQQNRLLLVIDEFSNTVSDDDEILQDCIKIVREGGGLGVHLWICSQKLAGSKDVPPEFYQNLNMRFIGSTAGNLAEARINGGEDSLAHKLPVGRGLFEFHNNDVLLGDKTPVTVRSMYIPDLSRDVPRYVKEIQERWEGKRPHWTTGGQMRRLGSHDPKFIEIVAKRADEAPLRPVHVQEVHQELTGTELDYRKAVKVIEFVQCFA